MSVFLLSTETWVGWGGGMRGVPGCVNREQEVGLESARSKPVFPEVA